METHTASPRLRIAMLSLHSSPLGPLGTIDTGGMSVYVYELSRWLGAAGHRVDIFTCAGRYEPEQRLFPNVRLIHLRPDAMQAPAREEWPAILPQVFQSLDSFVRTQGIAYHIVHSHYWLSGVVGAIAQARWRRPHVTTFHTLGAVKNAVRAGETESRRRIAHERWLAMTADRVIVAAPRELENLVRLYHAPLKKLRVIPCGVNLDLFHPGSRAAARRRLGIDTEADIVLYVGRFAPVKGLDRLIAAVARLRARFAGLQLWIIGGDGPQAPASKALASLMNRLNLQTAIRFVGRLDQAELPLYYRAADLLALPSHYESFGLVVLEALACGVPVAAMMVGVIESLVREGVNGAVADSDRPNALDDAIARVLTQSGRGGWCTQRIRSTVEAYGWPRAASAMIDIYRSLVDVHDPAQSPPAATPCTGWPN